MPDGSLSTLGQIATAIGAVAALVGLRLFLLWCRRDARFERAQRALTAWLAEQETARQTDPFRVGLIRPVVRQGPPDLAVPTGPRFARRHVPVEGIVATDRLANGRSALGVGRCAHPVPGGEAIPHGASPQAAS